MQSDDIGKFPEPKRTPKAWTREQLEALFKTCAAQRGLYAGVPRSDWWLSLHLVSWDTAERIGAQIQVRFKHLDLKRGILSIPAELRKGGVDDAVYTLHPDTVALLARMKEARQAKKKDVEDELVWPWPFNPDTRYNHYRAILIEAGLPTDRSSKFHRMRKSVASHLHAGGFNATEALGHSSSEVTKGSYLDPSISGQTTPAHLLFRPTTKGGDAHVE
jgi:integrase